MKRIETTAGPLYQAPALAGISWIEHGFGTRGIGLDNYVSHFGLKGAAVARTNQTHGNRVYVLDGNVPKKVLQGDAFLTQSSNVICFVRTADCVPILLCDIEKRAVGAIHAGWRGHVCDVIGHTVRAMQDQFGSDASKLVAAIGPSICANCYAVGEDVIESFTQNGFADRLWTAMPDRKNYLLNLKSASEELLISAGLVREKITTLPLCTSCHNGDFASYRRERTEKARQVNFIYIK